MLGGAGQGWAAPVHHDVCCWALGWATRPHVSPECGQAALPVATGRAGWPPAASRAGGRYGIQLWCIPCRSGSAAPPPARVVVARGLGAPQLPGRAAQRRTRQGPGASARGCGGGPVPEPSAAAALPSRPQAGGPHPRPRHLCNPPSLPPPFWPQDETSESFQEWCSPRASVRGSSTAGVDPLSPVASTASGSTNFMEARPSADTPLATSRTSCSLEEAKSAHGAQGWGRWDRQAAGVGWQHGTPRLPVRLPHATITTEPCPTSPPPLLQARRARPPARPARGAAAAAWWMAPPPPTAATRRACAAALRWSAPAWTPTAPAWRRSSWPARQRAWRRPPRPRRRRRRPAARPASTCTASPSRWACHPTCASGWRGWRCLRRRRRCPPACCACCGSARRARWAAR